MDRLARIYEAQAKGFLDPFKQQELLATAISTLSQLSQAQLASSHRQDSMEELMVQYGEKLNAHIPILEKMDVVLDQLIKENAKRLAEQPAKRGWLGRLKGMVKTNKHGSDASHHASKIWKRDDHEK
jgi:hypothetical protein